MKNCLYGLGNFAEASKYGADQPRLPDCNWFGPSRNRSSFIASERVDPTKIRPDRMQTRTTEHSPAVRSGR